MDGIRTITDWRGKILGSTEQSGNRLWLYDFYGAKLGYYDSSANKTYDWRGGFVGQGNILIILLR